MSNLPPGVTGNEPQIAGYPEMETSVDCDQKDVTIATIGPAEWSAAEPLLLDALAKATRKEFVTSATLASIRSVLHVEVVDLKECPFSGDVTMIGADGSWWWTCPVCRFEHEIEQDDPYDG